MTEQTFTEWVTLASRPVDPRLCVDCGQTTHTVTTKTANSRYLTRKVCGCGHG